MNILEDIKAFHTKFELPALEFNDFLPQEHQHLRGVMLREEYRELLEAFEGGSLVNVADALIDFSYFAVGTLYLMNYPLPNMWHHMHQQLLEKALPYNPNFYAALSEIHQDVFDLSPQAWLARKPELMDSDSFAAMMDELSGSLAAYEYGIEQKDLAMTGGALLDALVNAAMTGLSMAIPMQNVWNIVHGTNMAKVRAARPEDSKRGSGFDVVKPAGWQSPEPAIHALLYGTAKP